MVTYHVSRHKQGFDLGLKGMKVISNNVFKRLPFFIHSHESFSFFPWKQVGFVLFVFFGGGYFYFFALSCLILIKNRKKKIKEKKTPCATIKPFFEYIFSKTWI